MQMCCFINKVQFHFSVPSSVVFVLVSVSLGLRTTPKEELDWLHIYQELDILKTYLIFFFLSFSTYWNQYFQENPNDKLLDSNSGIGTTMSNVTQQKKGVNDGNTIWSLVFTIPIPEETDGE